MLKRNILGKTLVSPLFPPSLGIRQDAWPAAMNLEFQITNCETPSLSLSLKALVRKGKPL